MPKTVLMNFTDGPKEVTVGDIFYSAEPHGRSGNLRVIIGIGNKYIKSAIQRESGTTWGETEYYIENGREKTIYTGGQAYSSKEAYERDIKENRFIKKLEEKIRYIKLNYQQAVKIAEILNIKIEE